MKLSPWTAPFAACGLLVAAFALWILVSPDRRPPPIVERQITEQDWLNGEAASRKFTAILRRGFSLGSGEPILNSRLIQQGFHRIHPGPETKLRWDQRQVLRYDWGGFPCGQHLTAQWQTNNHGQISYIVGYYSRGCIG